MSELIKPNSENSPLLAEPVIERKYTEGINDQPEQPASSGPEPAASQSGGSGDSQPQPGESQQFEPGKERPKEDKFQYDNIEDETKGFSFSQENDFSSGSDTDDATGGGGDFQLPTESAKMFANIAGDMIQVYLPQLTYSYCKVDIESIRMSVDDGQMAPNMLHVFEKVNENTEESLKIDDEEIKMLKKALSNWLVDQNIKQANSTTALIMVASTMMINHMIKAVKARNDNKNLVKQALRSSDPDIFSKRPEDQPKKENDNGKEKAA